MKKLSLLMFFLVLASCSRNGVSKWIDGSLPSLYSGIDMIQFREQVDRNPEAWDAAHAFLLRQDLDTLSPGVYPITDKGVYAIVSEYETKLDSKYEAHRAYIDIQYVTSGQEYIYNEYSDGFIPLNEYDEGKDIIFFSDKDSVDRYVADSNVMFIFFPSDAHKPSVAIEGPSAVRKVVVKIPFLVSGSNDTHEHR